MGRIPKITFFSDCPEPTYTDNPLCSILYFKYSERADIIVKRFMAYVGMPLKWENINILNLIKFKNCCKVDMAPNSVATTCAWLSTAISIYAKDNGFEYRDACDILTSRREQGSFTFVTEEDMEKLIEYYKTCEDVLKRAVAANAIVEFYTGARKSDVTSFSESNIERSATYIDKLTGEIRYSEMLSYTSQKTKIRASIPLKPIVSEILRDTSIADVNVSTNLMNTKIKEIVVEAGFDRIVHERRCGVDRDSLLSECISSHTFRRSFATNLDRKGVPIEMTSRMMGHTNTQQTRRYVCGGMLVLDNEAINFFN